MISPAERRFLAAASVLALGLPVALHLAVEWRLRGHALPALSAAVGEPVEVAGVDVGLTGTIALRDVRVGDVVSASSVEAAVGFTHLVAGQLVADEIRVASPRVSARVVDGKLAVGRLLERAPRPASRGAGPRRPYRVVLSGGELVVDVAGHGELRARDVELHPQEGGVRVVTGETSAELAIGPWRAHADFARAGLDVDLPSLRVTRAALDGGHASVAGGGEAMLELDELVVVRGAETQLRGRIAGGGPLDVTLDGDGARVAAEGLPLEPLAPLLPSWVVPAGRVSGLVRVARGGRAEASLRVAGVALRHPLLATTPLPFDGSVDVDGRWDAAARAGEAHVALALRRLVVEGDVALALDERGGVRRASVDATVPRLPCADALAALPAPLAAPLVGLDLGGDLGGGVQLAFDLARPDEAHLDFEIDAGCRVLRDEAGAAAARIEGAYEHTLPDGRVRVLAASDPDFVPLAALPAHVAGAFVAAEDARFFEHHGFDEEQLRRSFGIDVAAGRVERGGSTISQQLAKNLFLGRERTLARKLVEAVLTWNLEQRLSKKRILEAYLNVIELGDGVYGIGPAAQRWFGKPAARLHPAEAAFLAAITPGPRLAEERLGKSGRLDAAMVKRCAIVLAAMRRAHLVHAADMPAHLAELDKLRLRVLTALNP